MVSEETRISLRAQVQQQTVLLLQARLAGRLGPGDGRAERLHANPPCEQSTGVRMPLGGVKLMEPQTRPETPARREDASELPNPLSAEAASLKGRTVENTVPDERREKSETRTSEETRIAEHAAEESHGAFEKRQRKTIPLSSS
uniref:Uncharacterized protein n=1 Tax=Toxoplasma gondii COUG TaxID=1074873 RepID=A0A2G8YC36_TOXGO|nr:hypothetical protein TGCOUG_391450 [Toxoplasma gondii COUG]